MDEQLGKGTSQSIEGARWLCRNDLFFLLRYACQRHDCENDWVFERCREVYDAPDGFLDLWAREHYKDLADDTPILTANRGWTTHGSIVVGDKVFSPDGAPVSVLALSSRYTDSECYKVDFSDGASIVCGAGHLWRIRRKVRRRVPGGRAIELRHHVLRTDELAVGADVGALSVPLEGDQSSLPLDPYVLGAWLGDGTTGSARITAGADDADTMEALLQSRGIKVRRVKHSNSVSLAIGTGVRGCRESSDVVNALRELGIYKAKRIPDEYMRASATLRMALLRGLMDTDGSCDTRGTAIFCNANKMLAEGVYDLAATLALRPRWGEYKGVEGRIYFQVRFQAHQDRNPFLMERKASRAIAPSEHRKHRSVVSINKVESVPTRCIQVEGGMYLAGREMVPTHNSTVITFAKTIQDVLINPEETIGIFSHTRPIAKGFLRQIKQEFEGNTRLKEWFPDIVWQNPRKDAPKWSEDDGIVLRRESNPKESTVEAWGVVDGQPTSKHFSILNYDDVVTRESVTTPEMTAKTTDALALSFNLGTSGGRRRFIGTRYHYNDAYRTIMDRGTAKPRIYAATVDGTVEGAPRFLSREALDEKRADQGPYVFACQMLQDPKADETQGFKPEWLHYATPNERGLNIVMLFDPASAKKKSSDYTSGWVLGLGGDRNIYVLDMTRDRLNLTERADLVFAWHRKWRPMAVGYEKYGMMADIEHIKDRQERENYRFEITELGGAQPKVDRIRRLIPWFEKGRIYLPVALMKTNYEGRTVDLVKAFVDEEYKAFPVSAHDDMLDALARVLDGNLPVEFPSPTEGVFDDDERIVGRSAVTGY